MYVYLGITYITTLYQRCKRAVLTTVKNGVGKLFTYQYNFHMFGFKRFVGEIIVFYMELTIRRRLRITKP